MELGEIVTQHAKKVAFTLRVKKAGRARRVLRSSHPLRHNGFPRAEREG